MYDVIVVGAGSAGATLAARLSEDSDRRVLLLEAGGRVYLGKDARLSEAHFKAMYPEWETWRELKLKVDPQRLFRSALSDRLGLC